MLLAEDRSQTANARKKDNINSYRGYNLIIISLGNVGAKYMSLYGYNRKTTPLLDEWFKDAVVFNYAFSPASWTLPVGTSLFTSLQPYSHKVYHRRHNNILDANIETLPEILKKAGYKTAAFTGGLDYDPHFGHMRGFEEAPKNTSFTSFVKTLDQTQKWLDNNKDSKFFVFIHGYDSHCPFNPPAQIKGMFSSSVGKKITVGVTRCYRGWETGENGKYISFYQNKIKKESLMLTQDDINYLRDLYDEEVLYEDYLVGQFLNSLDKDLLSKTIIIVLGDHGELFAKQGRFGRAGSIRGTYDDAVVHVPLMIKLPRNQSHRVEGFVQLIDVMPTALNMLNLPGPPYMQGKDLTPLIKNRKELNQFVFGGTKYWANKHYRYISTSEYIRSQEWKLVHESRRRIKLNFDSARKHKKSNREEDPDDDQEEDPRESVNSFRSYVDQEEQNPTFNDDGPEDVYHLYNIRQDPDEINNLYENKKDTAMALKIKLDLWIKETSAFDAHNKSKKIFSEDKLKQIREGGYW